jgi:hypothetical protein
MFGLDPVQKFAMQLKELGFSCGLSYSKALSM